MSSENAIMLTAASL